MLLPGTHTHEADGDDDEADERGQPASDPVSEWPEQVGADQVGDGGRQEDGAQLPLVRLHRVHHVDGQRRLQHGDARVGDGDGACGE